MLVRRLCAALISTALATGAFVAVAAPSHAEGDYCSTATPFTGNVASTVGPGDTYDHWRYEAKNPGTYRFTMNSSQGTAIVYVYDDINCDSVRCINDSGEACVVSITTATTFAFRVREMSATTPNAYTLAAEWTTQPRLGLQCSDGVDNDGDGFADTADTGCTGPLDTSETGSAAPCPSIAGVVTCLSLTAGEEITRVHVYGPDVDVPVTVLATVDLYQFTLPGGGIVNLPCVVVNDVNPCAALGGTFFANMAKLGPATVSLLDPVIDEHITSVGLCEATLTATVNDIGIQSLGAATLC